MPSCSTIASAGLVLLATLTLAAPCRAQTSLAPAEVEAIDAVFATFDDTRSPGCALGVVRGGELVFARGYGMANLEYGIPLTPRSVFRTGSVSKQFTAATVALLALDGVLDLDADVRAYLPELPDFGTPVTLRHLIHHTSGYRDYLTLMDLAGKREADYYDDPELLAMLSRQEELNFAPGQEHLYSNSGYFLLSQIVLRTTGRSLAQEAEDRIFRPLGMEETHYHDDHRRLVPNRAAGYAPERDGGYVISQTTLPMIGDGGVFTSVEEISPWVANLMEPSLGGEPFLELIRTRGVLNSGDTLSYAFGLTHGSHRGLATLGHGGSFVGYRANVLTYPEQDLGIVALCNRADASAGEYVAAVGEVLLEDVMAPREPEGGRAGSGRAAPPLVAPVPTSEMEPLTGSYHSRELDATWTLEVAEGELHLTVGNMLDGPLVPLRSADGELRWSRGRVTLRFSTEAGEVTGFRVDAGRVQNLRFERR